MNKDFDEILDNCINLIKNGEDDVVGCLARYPEYGNELKPLLDIFVALERTPKPKPSSRFKNEARQRLLKRAKSMATSPLPLNQVKHRRFSPLKPILVQIAAMILIVVFLSGGTVMASTDSLPGDLLYSIKIATERAQLSLAFTEATKADLHLKFAERRLEEIRIMTQGGMEVELDNVVNSMTEHLNKAMNLAREMPKERSEEMLLKISQFVQREQESLRQVAEESSSKNRETIRNTIEATKGDGSKDEPGHEDSKTPAGTEGAEGGAKDEGSHNIESETKNNMDTGMNDANDASPTSETRSDGTRETDFMKKLEGK